MPVIKPHLVQLFSRQEMSSFLSGLLHDITQTKLYCRSSHNIRKMRTREMEFVEVGTDEIWAHCNRQRRIKIGAVEYTRK